MQEIKSSLKANGFSQKQIEKFVKYYEYAVDNNIPYPYFYAMTKLSV